MNEHLLHGFHQRGYLPHLKHVGASYFVTFRLADSLPREALNQLETEVAALRFPAKLSSVEIDVEKHRERRRRIEVSLDQGSVSCCLRIPEIGRFVAGALRHFDGDRYVLEAWVVMPNHVHVLLRPGAGRALGEIVKSWKQFTSTRAKGLIGLPPGRFWQPEAYDHWVRDDADRARIVRYIHNNPVKAKLCAVAGAWPWSSAAKQ